ncbi:acyl-CoA dehydrogenase/oxidase [Mycena alexandri]|uniref:Acyl-CoA dehydrogenase/oxidase n=1 Tax=Mycena alexandri TaxID=1745969 RepID=A0AAD6XH09_9AGAR|nr:acyl-CoA dehydrogenase/oxidase [Mycena alexandri]
MMSSPLRTRNSHVIETNPVPQLPSSTLMTTKQYTEEEVAKVLLVLVRLKGFLTVPIKQHNKEGDLWVTIDAKVYNLSKFADLHPGGANVLFADGVAGKDATQAFFGLHRLEVLHRPQYARLQIGTILGEESVIKAPAPGEVSRVPYAEPTWLASGFQSPYYTAGHRKFQKAVRTFFMEVVQPAAIQCEENGKRIPQEVVDKMAEVNVIAMRLGPGKHLKGRTLMNGTVTPEEFDYFHELILNTELARFGTRGFVDGLLNGAVIGVPPILNYGSPELQARVVPEILNGKKFLALAISEAFAGSDVSGLQTTAVRDGDFWVVTGTKKWITNGTYADYFTTGCKTETGFTVILIERSDNLSTKAIKTSYSATAGTAYVTFDKVRVPVGNTLGAVGNGMNVILTNFNHERWMVICTALSAQRLVVEECMKWASQRMVFGKPLTSQAVIRSKLAGMISRVEAGQNWLEHITHQMNNMTYAEMGSKLAGPIGLLKSFVTRSGEETAADATQIFGGRALTVSGMGKVIENYRRTSAFDAILAGAEDVMADLGVRQAMKKMPSNARM